MVTEKKFNEDCEEVISCLVREQYKLIKKVEKYDPKDYDDEWGDPYCESYIGYLDHELDVFGICWYPKTENHEGGWYICYDNIGGKDIEYEEHGRRSDKPFTEKEIRDYVESIYGELSEYDVWYFDDIAERMYEYLEEKKKDIAECDKMMSDFGFDIDDDCYYYEFDEQFDYDDENSFVLRGDKIEYDGYIEYDIDDINSEEDVKKLLNELVED